MPSTTRQHRKRRNKQLVQQRKVERDFRKKYKKQTEGLANREGGLLPPTVWNYRKALVFNAAASQNRGIEELLAARLGPGSYRTHPASGSDDN